MNDRFMECLARVLKHEGGYINDPLDNGGRTNLGVTQRVWEEWVGHPVSEADMKALTPEKVAPMYKMKYWNPSYCEKLPKGLDYVVFDFAVNAGTGRSVKTLQSAIGVVADGVIGPRYNRQSVSWLMVLSGLELWQQLMVQTLKTLLQSFQTLGQTSIRES